MARALSLLYLVAFIAAQNALIAEAHPNTARVVKAIRSDNVEGGHVYEKTFLAKFELGPGDIYNEWVELEMPKGKIAIETFNADIVDQRTDTPCCNTKESVSLTEIYLHHWTINIFEVDPEIKDVGAFLHPSGSVGPCSMAYHQMFGVGSEARNTNTTFPHPFAMVVNLPENQRWVANIHAIDTRQVRDVRGCIECNCEELGIDPKKWGVPEMESYIGGLECCHSTRKQNASCPLVEGVAKPDTKTYYLRYTVRWRDVDECTVPVDVMVLDVTDGDGAFWTHKPSGMGCMIEYTLGACDVLTGPLSGCVNIMTRQWAVPYDMDLVFMYGHQHFAGLGTTLYRDGDADEMICDSLPLYGHGHGSEVGKEAGYITGMTTCAFPEGLSLKAGELLGMTSTYLLDSRPHTGVMGLWYIAFVDRSKPDTRPDHCKAKDVPKIQDSETKQHTWWSMGGWLNWFWGVLVG